jgi:hypothetical protein
VNIYSREYASESIESVETLDDIDAQDVRREWNMEWSSSMGDSDMATSMSISMSDDGNGTSLSCFADCCSSFNTKIIL